MRADDQDIVQSAVILATKSVIEQLGIDYSVEEIAKLGNILGRKTIMYCDLLYQDALKQKSIKEVQDVLREIDNKN